MTHTGYATARSEKKLHKEHPAYADAACPLTLLVNSKYSIQPDRSPPIKAELFLTDSDTLDKGGFICKTGGHLVPDDDGCTREGVTTIHVPFTVVGSDLVKLVVYRGECLLWDARLPCMDDRVTCKRKRQRSAAVKLIRPSALHCSEVASLQKELDQNGYAVATGVVDETTLVQCEADLCREVCLIFGMNDLEMPTRALDLPQKVHGCAKSGGAAIGAVSCTKAVWKLRMFTADLFSNLMGVAAEDLCVSIDRVFLSKEHQRCSVKVSFGEKRFRTEQALKRKLIALATGRAQTGSSATAGYVASDKSSAEVDSSWLGLGQQNPPRKLTETVRRLDSVKPADVPRTIDNEARRISLNELQQWIPPAYSNRL